MFLCSQMYHKRCHFGEVKHTESLALHTNLELRNTTCVTMSVHACCEAVSLRGGLEQDGYDSE